MKNVAALLCFILFLLSAPASAVCSLDNLKGLATNKDQNYPNALSCTSRKAGFCAIWLSDLNCLQSLEKAGQPVPPIALDRGEVVIWIGDVDTPSSLPCQQSVKACARFAFGEIKAHDPHLGDVCGAKDTKHRPFANKFDNDKTDDAGNPPRYEHLKATTVSSDTADGACYGHNIQFEDGTPTIDPHIIIGGTGIQDLQKVEKVLRPTVRHKKK